MQINDFDKVHAQQHAVYVSKDIEWRTADDRELRDKSFTFSSGSVIYKDTEHQNSPKQWQQYKTVLDLIYKYT